MRLRYFGNRSRLRHEVIDVSGLDELCRVFAYGECLEVSFAAFNLGAFLVAKVLGEQAALGFDDEVEALRTILLNQRGPVWVVGS